MNSQSGFIKNLFLVFIVVASSAFAAIPVVSQTSKTFSDSYVISQMHILQSEMILKALDQTEPSKLDCLQGEVNHAVTDIILESQHGVLCRINTRTSEMVAFTRISTGSLYCVDSNGGRLYVENDPEQGYYCH